MLITGGAETDKVYLYKNPTPDSTPPKAPLGTGLNFTLY